MTTMNMTTAVQSTRRSHKLFLTSGEAAKLLGCSTNWIKYLIARGALDTHRIGNSGWHRISAKALQKYAHERNVTLDWTLL